MKQQRNKNLFVSLKSGLTPIPSEFAKIKAVSMSKSTVKTSMKNKFRKRKNGRKRLKTKLENKETDSFSQESPTSAPSGSALVNGRKK